MKRLAFTIIFNGEHHLLHNNYAEYLLNDVLDYWVIVEGSCHSTGSTSWCRGSNEQYHVHGHSTDETLCIINDLQKKYPNKCSVVLRDGPWSNKDEMVNAAIKELKNHYNRGMLHQIDIDEQWIKSDMIENESFLLSHGAKSGDCNFNQFIGKDIIAVGTNWGGNTITRLWDWNGEYFSSHEPPRLYGNNEPFVLLPKKYHHYSYVFEKDVRFKCDWYGYGDDFFERWKVLQTQTEFPRPLSELFPGWEGVDGIIKRIEL